MTMNVLFNMSIESASFADSATQFYILQKDTIL